MSPCARSGEFFIQDNGFTGGTAPLRRARMASRRSGGMGFMGLSGSAAAAAHPILAHNFAAWTTILTQGAAWAGHLQPVRHELGRGGRKRLDHRCLKLLQKELCTTDYQLYQPTKPVTFDNERNLPSHSILTPSLENITRTPESIFSILIQPIISCIHPVI